MGNFVTKLHSVTITCGIGGGVGDIFRVTHYTGGREGVLMLLLHVTFTMLQYNSKIFGSVTK